MLTQLMIQNILLSEDSSSRFERFCIEIFGLLDGVEYVTTSSSWDMGRDGRQASLFNTDVFPSLCVSLNEKVPGKVKADLKRLSSTTEFASLRFCSSQPLSEHARDKIRGEVRTIAPQLTIAAVEGAEQIGAIIRRDKKYTSVFERHYPGEIASERAARAAENDDDETRITGMRIALSTQLTNDGEALREDLIHNLILTALGDGKDRTLGGIARRLTESLCLGEMIQGSYFAPVLARIVDAGLVAARSSSYRITPEGLEAIETRKSRQDEMLGQGQEILRTAVADLSGRTLSAADHSIVWKTVMEELSQLLYLNGMQTIDALATLAHQREQGIVGLFDNLHRIDQLAEKIKQSLGNSPISEEVGQAIVDSFHDTTSQLFDWFTKLCACFTAICALGLSEQSQMVLVRRLRTMNLFLDTDIALSLMAEGEPDHERVTTLIQGWQRVGGGINVAEPVLEELAYHAYISETDFREVYHQLPKYTESDARRLITNAFVRGYWSATKRIKAAFSHKTWREYIGNFRGSNDRDHSKIAADLREEKVNTVAPIKSDPALAAFVSDMVMKMRAENDRNNTGRHTKKFLDKSERDGRFVAAVIAFRHAKDKDEESAVIVSSSPLLAKVCRNSRLTTGGDPLVLSVPALAYLLSLVPGAHISLFGLRKLLFDTRFHEHVKPLERRALRVLQDSTEFSLPFARRARLSRAVHERILKVGEEKGLRQWESFDELENKSEESMRLFAEIVRESVDAISISASEKENMRLKNENALLREELERAREARRSS